MADLSITSLRGGMNNSDPASSLSEDQCVLARNAEFFDSMLGERRNGSITIDVSGSGLVGHAAVTFLHRHLPTTDETAAELFALGVTFAPASCTLVRKTSAWSAIAPDDAITATGVYPFQVQALSFHGKCFIAYKSGQDRLHVWDGTDLRRT